MGGNLAPATKSPAKIITATMAPTTISTRPIRPRNRSVIKPPMVAAADTVARNPIATQNSWSVRHHPDINEVAMTAVAQPLMMLTAAVADAAQGLGRATARADGRTAFGSILGR
ncbi:MAG: hypothetical protein QOJ80_3556 [Mycobacterium sp.]|nr:hypothetical protein [Mycobacterium sp.]